MTMAYKDLQTIQASQELLFPMIGELSGLLDLQTVLERVLYLSMQSVGGTGGSLIVCAEDGQPVNGLSVIDGKVQAQGAGARFTPFEQDLAKQVARTRESISISDTRLEKRWLGEGANGAGVSPRSAVSAPLMAPEQFIGVISLFSRQANSYSPGQLNLLQAIAGMAGMAIQQALLFQCMQADHQRYQELFAGSLDPTLITGWDGRVLEFNRRAQEMLGLQPGEPGFSIYALDIVKTDKVGEDFQNLRNGGTIQYETSLRREGELESPVQVYIRQVQLGGRSQLQWILRDITERKHLDRLREDLISMIYHDLRSPLGNIVSSLDVVNSLLDHQQGSDLHPLLNIAMRSTERIQRLTNSLLDINWLEAGQPITNRQVYDLDELTREAVEAVETTAQSKELRIHRSGTAGLPRISVDAEMIRRVLINLMENAIKYTPTGSKIVLGVEQVGEYVHLWIQDEGPGIPHEAQVMIFDKFARLNATRDQRGFGLGLAYCRLAVQGHGGKIWVESQPGCGASFHFTLPISGC